ncbi:hypothetical protein EYF80_015034 [Liparis tanakae]|uniref:Uncharacterized protein n=1 Tax=Liparis tanakae TaxID=230148 RepID=A0A4Z2I9L8_9TELE|nr:hypothetical protein EYF80_015034 [Liparis tanakae]
MEAGFATRHEDKQKCLCLSATRQRTNEETVGEQLSRCKALWVGCLVAAAGSMRSDVKGVETMSRAARGRTFVCGQQSLVMKMKHRALQVDTDERNLLYRERDSTRTPPPPPCWVGVNEWFGRAQTHHMMQWGGHWADTCSSSQSYELWEEWRRTRRERRIQRGGEHDRLHGFVQQKGKKDLVASNGEVEYPTAHPSLSKARGKEGDGCRGPELPTVTAPFHPERSSGGEERHMFLVSVSLLTLCDDPELLVNMAEICTPVSCVQKERLYRQTPPRRPLRRRGTKTSVTEGPQRITKDSTGRVPVQRQTGSEDGGGGGGGGGLALLRLSSL